MSLSDYDPCSRYIIGPHRCRVPGHLHLLVVGGFVGLLSEMTGSWHGREGMGGEGGKGRGGTADSCEFSPGKLIPKASWVGYEVHQEGGDMTRCWVWGSKRGYGEEDKGVQEGYERREMGRDMGRGLGGRTMRRDKGVRDNRMEGEGQWGYSGRDTWEEGQGKGQEGDSERGVGKEGHQRGS